MRFDPHRLCDLLSQSPAPVSPPSPSERPATVFALFVDRDQTNLLFIRRAELGDPWSGQIAFPGGHVQPDDPSPLAAAYRELAEEVGIQPHVVACLGDLGLFPTHAPRVTVRAFVGWWTGLHSARPDAAEVAAVFEVSVAHLLRRHHHAGFDRQTAHQLGDRLVYPLPEPVLRRLSCPDAAIWGVTARILHRLLNLLVV